MSAFSNTLNKIRYKQLIFNTHHILFFSLFFFFGKKRKIVHRTKRRMVAEHTLTVCVALARRLLSDLLINRVLFAVYMSYWIVVVLPLPPVTTRSIRTDVGIFNEVRGNHTLVKALQILLNLFVYSKALPSSSFFINIVNITKFTLMFLITSVRRTGTNVVPIFRIKMTE